MIVLLWSRATRDLLKSFGWGIGHSISYLQRRWCHFPRRLPHTISLLEETGFENSVPRCLSPPATPWAPSFRSEWRLLEPPEHLYRFAEADDCSMIPSRRRSIGPNPTEAAKPLPILRGTEISNPVPSSGKSPFLVGIRLPSSRRRGFPRVRTPRRPVPFQNKADTRSRRQISSLRRWVADAFHAIAAPQHHTEPR
jgi:hypothetical protein